MGADFVQIGQNIRKFRNLANLTQEQLAELTGYSNSHIGSIENANGIPSFDALSKIADALNITMDQLCFGSIKNPDSYLLREFNRLTEGFGDKEKRCSVDMITALLEQYSKHIKGNQN